jgi:hypothetical protein
MLQVGSTRWAFFAGKSARKWEACFGDALTRLLAKWLRISLDFRHYKDPIFIPHSPEIQRSTMISWIISRLVASSVTSACTWDRSRSLISPGLTMLPIGPLSQDNDNQLSTFLVIFKCLILYSSILGYNR